MTFKKLSPPPDAQAALAAARLADPTSPPVRVKAQRPNLSSSPLLV